MRLTFITFLGMLIVAIIIDLLGIQSAWTVFLFGLGWLGLLTTGIFWAIKKRTCGICNQTWSIADINDFSRAKLKSLFTGCPKCMKSNKFTNNGS